MTKENKQWSATAHRFVAFFDIMGFKEIVERNSHSTVVGKLQILKEALKDLEAKNHDTTFKEKYLTSETKSITFSDSIIIFSKSDTVSDACKIILDAGYLIKIAIENKIAIKGALSYGEITVDFENSLFFGRPIIDSYLLHDQLQLYSAVFDNNFEYKMNSFKLPEPFQSLITTYKANLKTGKITHQLVRMDTTSSVKEQIISLKEMYGNVSGSPRIYIDNTIEFLNSLLPKTIENNY